MKIIEDIKDKILAYKVSKHPVQQAPFPNYSSIRSVLILFESDLMEKNNTILQLRDELLKDEKDVVLLGYADKKEIQSLVLPQRRILGQHDLTFWGGLQENIITDLTARNYDLLIDLTQHDVRPLLYAACYAKAEFKTGLKRDLPLYQFMVEMAPLQDPTFLFHQILFYLRNIQSNDKK